MNDPSRSWVWAALLLGIAGCGDDAGATPDSGARDATVDAPVVRRDSGPPDAGPPPDDTPTKGPWAIRVEPTSATVRWETRLEPDPVAIEVEPVAGGAVTVHMGTATSRAITSEYGVDSPIVTIPDYPGRYAISEVVVTGLAPATCYRYRIAGHLESGGRFCTGHEPGDGAPIRFLAIGDTNPSLGHTEGVMANAPLDAIEFTVHAGDIQYYSSLIESWASWFPQMEPLMSAAAFMPCIGNHEREDAVAMEFEDYYRRFWGGAGEGDDIRYHFATGGVHFFSLSTEDGLYPGQPQVAWLEAELDAVAVTPGYRFSVLYMHRPPYSVSDEGPAHMVRMAIAPSVMEHGIPLVIAGHAHGYERFEVGETTYLVTGGGGGALGNVDERLDEFPEDAALRASAGDFYHSVVITIDATEIRGETIDEEGMIRDTFTRALP